MTNWNSDQSFNKKCKTYVVIRWKWILDAFNFESINSIYALMWDWKSDSAMVSLDATPASCPSQKASVSNCIRKSPEAGQFKFTIPLLRRMEAVFTTSIIVCSDLSLDFDLICDQYPLLTNLIIVIFWYFYLVYLILYSSEGAGSRAPMINAAIQAL